ncbi:MAG: sugar ABC transporter permease [Lachnospiraceae bacterium]|nr:sugar ABC transporter permease [Lachnospiraceae bacterium]
MNFIGLKNYVKVLQDRDFYAAMLRTLLYTLVNVPFKVLLPLGTAVLLTSKRLRCRTFFRAGLYIPVLLSSLIVGITINWMFGQEYGLINFMIQKLGGTALEWSMNPVLAETVISIASNWASLGYFMLIFIGAINNVPKELYEAASIDGADRWQSFLHITIPMIAPETFLVLMLSTNDLLKEYAVVQGVTRGGPGSSTTFILQYIYEQGFNSGKNGYASAISVLAMVVFLAIALVQFKFTNGGDDND